jgi:hypothetical protein
METSFIIGGPVQQYEDPHKAAEAFIDKVVTPRRQPPARDPETARARAELARESRKLALHELEASGLSHERLRALAADRSKARRKLAEEAHRRAVDASAETARRLADMWPVILPADPMEIVLDEVLFIRSFLDQGLVIDSNIAPGDNWARYKLEASAGAVEESGTGRLSFFTLWQNPRNKGVILQPTASLVVNAHLSTGADWGGVASWFFPDSEARASVRARTTVWRMDSSISSIVADLNLGSAGASGGFFGDDNDTSIEFSGLLPTSGVQVQVQQYVLIEVELLTEWTALDGQIHLDAESGSFKVSVPQLTLTVTDL